MKRKILTSLLLAMCLIGCGQNHEVNNIDNTTQNTQESSSTENSSNSSVVLVSKDTNTKDTNTKTNTETKNDNTSANDNPSIIAMPSSDFDITVHDESIPGGQADAHILSQKHQLDISITSFSSAIDVPTTTSKIKSVVLSDPEWELFTKVFEEYNTIKQDSTLNESMPLLVNLNESSMYYLINYLYDR